jgi:hypothetical protein
MKKIIALMMGISFAGCLHSKDTSHAKNVDLIKSFLSDLDQSDNTELLNKYFVALTETQIKNGSVEFRNNVMNNLREKIKGKSYTIMSFNEVRDNPLRLTEDMNSKEIFVIVIEGEKNIHVKIDRDKIESISPMMKGNQIIGWL